MNTEDYIDNYNEAHIYPPNMVVVPYEEVKRMMVEYGKAQNKILLDILEDLDVICDESGQVEISDDFKQRVKQALK